jgi:hypothetical protein
MKERERNPYTHTSHAHVWMNTHKVNFCKYKNKRLWDWVWHNPSHPPLQTHTLTNTHTHTSGSLSSLWVCRLQTIGLVSVCMCVDACVHVHWCVMVGLDWYDMNWDALHTLYFIFVLFITNTHNDIRHHIHTCMHTHTCICTHIKYDSISLLYSVQMCCGLTLGLHERGEGCGMHKRLINWD